MLKDIRLHLDDDESRQHELDNQLSERILTTRRKNERSFRQHIPSVLALIQQNTIKNISVFNNRWAEPNLVDYSNGRTFYGLTPQQEIKRQVDLYSEYSLYIPIDNTHLTFEPDDREDLLRSSNRFRQLEASSALPDSVDVMVVLGVGLGLHLLSLLEKCTIKHLIVYEPEMQFFQVSSMVEDWSKLLNLAAKQKTAIYLQIGKDGRDLVSDITELREHVPFSGFYLYRHYHHPVFNSIELQLRQRSWKEISDKGFTYEFTNTGDDYLPRWTPVIDPFDYQDADPHASSRYEKNLAAFKRYYPNIHKEFKNYKPSKWLTVTDNQGNVNVVHKDFLAPLCGDDPKSECLQNFENFARHPNKDGLVLGYKGTKLKHYYHYQFVNQTESLLNNDEQIGQLPETVKSLIMFGIGLGYQLEQLFQNHRVEKLFLCEPNRDFFYASLFAIDWHQILETVDKSNGRLYINIGDDGSHLFRDLLNQFYAIGPYVLANTYFYQSYYNASLVSAVAQLREQLQVVISMGEYFDHAYYGINHTIEGVGRGFGHLVSHPDKHLSFRDKDVPVFIVGNGPSLDYSIDIIKEYQNQAIVVSCGTSLQVLYKNGIRPDYHAEIEQNRSTYDWAMRLGSLNYLKEITLISCNGIHPDTCNLYKNVLISFKEGESSTVSSLNVLGKENFQALNFSFPTVSNFVVDLFTTLGFSQLYFMGVDLGFVDVEHHHSKASGYYDDKGNPLVDYKDRNFTGLIVEGNFKPTVNTKHEFKVSKMVIEDRLRAAKGDFFNTSNGAKIAGAIPLRVEDVLIVSSHQDKSRSLHAIENNAFTLVDGRNFAKEFSKKYSKTLLREELSNLIETIDQTVESEQQAISIIEDVKQKLFSSYQQGRSLLFYYLYGTSNYANALMFKMLNVATDGDLSLFNQAREIWLNNLQKIVWLISDKDVYFDVSSSFINQRTQSYFKQKRNEDFNLVTNQKNLVQVANACFSLNNIENKVKVYGLSDILARPLNEKSSNILYVSSFNDLVDRPDLLSLPWSLIFVEGNYFDMDCHKLKVPVLFSSGDFRLQGHPASCHPLFHVYLAFAYAKCTSKIKVMIPKFLVTDIDEIPADFGSMLLQYDYAYDCGRVIGFTNDPLEENEMIMSNGARAIRLHTPVDKDKFVQMFITPEVRNKMVENIFNNCPVLRESY